jgi:hypothetical protein
MIPRLALPLLAGLFARRGVARSFGGRAALNLLTPLLAGLFARRGVARSFGGRAALNLLTPLLAGLFARQGVARSFGGRAALNLLTPLLALPLLACADPDPVQTCDDLAAQHCDRVAGCAVTPQDTDACIIDTRLQMGCPSATDTTSSLSRCERELAEGTCATYLQLPSSCLGAFTSD